MWQESDETPARVSVEWVLRVLAVHYGDAWTRKWDGIEPRLLYADWERTIGGCSRVSAEHAITVLGAWPPNATEFRALCLAAPAPQRARLAAPRSARRAEDMPELGAALARAMAGRADPLAGARRLREREESGDRSLTAAQREFWRAALRRAA